jgi:drug/metabolite transporter (DMT)-like permease
LTLPDRGIAAALGAALLFGAGIPFAKLLLGQVSPWLPAGLLYLGSGLGLAAWRGMRSSTMPRLTGAEMGWLAAAILAGGMVAPVLLMWGLSHMPASGVALLLNAEALDKAAYVGTGLSAASPSVDIYHGAFAGNPDLDSRGYALGSAGPERNFGPWGAGNADTYGTVIPR